MSARHKLKSANLYFCLLMAGIVGLLMESWAWFVLAAVVCVTASVHAGDIRLRPTGRRPRRRR